MRKTIRLLKWINEDLTTGMIETSKLYGAEMVDNPEIAEEISKANKNLNKAYKSVTKALDILNQIYQECYDD